jgi:predicted N-acetyltransferase YhbS
VQSIFGRPQRFVLPTIRTLPDGASLREYRATDRDACVALYAANETGRFPKGLRAQFEQTLDRIDYLKLVCCLHAEVVAIGAVGRFPRMLGPRHVWLVFGMVHPKIHGQGIGTALLLARVAALGEPFEPTKILLANVASSERFVSRFGFEYQGQMAMRPGGDVLDVRGATLDADTWSRCREVARELGFAHEEAPEIPLVDLRVKTVPQTADG